MLHVAEEGTSTPVNLIKISVFAAVAFLLMAAMVDEHMRSLPLVIGALILLLLGIAAAWLAFQRRYGDAYLKATTELAAGRVFQGEIETGFTRKPTGPIRIIIDGWYEGAIIRVAPEQLRLGPSGRVIIPFSIPIPIDEYGRPIGRVRMYVRTRTWPLGWGVTFLLHSPFSLTA